MSAAAGREALRQQSIFPGALLAEQDLNTGSLG